MPEGGEVPSGERKIFDDLKIVLMGNGKLYKISIDIMNMDGIINDINNTYYFYIKSRKLKRGLDYD